MARMAFACLLASALLIAATSVDAKTKRKPSSQDRPPQFVMLAFDGSLNIPFWDESYAFADSVATNQDMTDKSGKLRFTYFMSGVYYTADLPQTRALYAFPPSGKPKSCIGWADGLADVKPKDGAINTIPLRIARTNRAYNAGHELGSHVNAHCGQDGKEAAGGPLWTTDQWNEEFQEFDNLIFNSFKNNGLAPIKAKYSNGFDFDRSEIVGFRAPLLENKTAGPALRKFGYKYDTSGTALPQTWPQRNSWGGWDFPLGYIKVANSTRKTPMIAMDYNWLYFHSAGASIKNIAPAQVQQIKNQVLDSYKYYFKQNYFGNRAPVNIGHHFSKWNGGAYWMAMKEFAQFVCAKPEVRCVTYTTYMNWLDDLERNHPDQLKAYRHGQFERMADDHTIKDIAAPIVSGVRLATGDNAFETMLVDPADAGKLRVQGWQLQLKVNDQVIPGAMITKDQVVRMFGQDSSVLVRASLVNRAGADLDWETFRVDHLGVDGQETISSHPLEDDANRGEGSDAHAE